MEGGGRRIVTGKRIAELQAGDRADLFALAESVAEKRSKKGDPFLVLQLTDPSGRATVYVWPDKLGEAYDEVRALEPGTPIKVRADRREDGTMNAIAVRRADDAAGPEVASLRPAVRPEALAVADGVVAFDIETCSRLDPADLPERERQKFLRQAHEDAERETGLEFPGDEAIAESLRKFLALNPLTTRVVSIAFAAVDSPAELVTVATDGEDMAPPALALGEAEMLATFWAVARRARTLVGFNSRKFDVPVLLTRSAMLGVPAGVDLLGQRWDPRQSHVDIQDVLAARGAAGDRRVSLELAAYAFGIPVKAQGHGSEVALYVEEGRWQELAEYNLEDARATARLYERLRGTWL